MKKRVLIIGWDCAAPELVFDAFKADMPNTHRLMAEGTYGQLESTIPPITVPAWMCMMTSRDPGELGIYGFRNRKDYAYDALTIANSHAVKVPTLWDLLGQAERNRSFWEYRSPTPQSRFRDGWSPVSSRLTAIHSGLFRGDYHGKSNKSQAATRSIFRIFERIGRAELEQQLLKMTAERFKLARHLLETKDWDFFTMVEMGSDRLHHAFWRFWDETHRKYEPIHPSSETMRNYYRILDAELGETLTYVDKETTIFIVSDHGAKRMDGGICINEWLQKHGYLTLKTKPQEMTRWTPDRVDWETQKRGEKADIRTDLYKR